MKKFGIVFFLACFLTGNIQASSSVDANEDCCRSSCYECGSNPLYECSWGLQVQGGVRPILWRHRGDFLAVTCANTSPVAEFGEISRFKQFYKLPWQVGGQVSYALSCNTNIFLEVNYAQAKGKKDCSDLSFGKYKLVDAYVGVRYYSDRCCDRVAFFVGAKAGLLHHKNVKTTSLNAIDCLLTAVPEFEFFKSNTAFAGGAHVGFDVCFCGNWSLVVTGEVVASCGPRSIDNIVLGAANSFLLSGASNIIVGNIETELAFPVTVGVKYNF